MIHVDQHIDFKMGCVKKNHQKIAAAFFGGSESVLFVRWMDGWMDNTPTRLIKEYSREIPLTSTRGKTQLLVAFIGGGAEC